MESRAKVAIYCRLSEEDKNKQAQTDESNSIQNQKSMLLQYALEMDWEVFRIYSDDDYTGADRQRPEFNRLLEDARNHEFEIILCKTQSRFTRELELVEKYIHGFFPLWGIRFISIVDHADTANRGNKKARQINGLVNEWYLEDMSENIKSVLNDRRKKGYHIGAFALYGYKKDPNVKGHLLVDEEAASVVREIFILFSQGYGKTAIARMLNDRGIPNPTEYKRRQGLHYKQSKTPNSMLWKYSNIADMLVNEMYIGNMLQGRYGSISYKTKQNKPRPREQWFRVEGTHEAIIDSELWESVQTLVRQRAKPFGSGEIGLFTGKVRCKNCGYAMRSTKNRGKHYLQCATHHIAKEACIGAFLSVEKLEKAVRDELCQLTETYLDKEELAQRVECTSDVYRQRENLEMERMADQKKIAEYTKGIRNLYLDKMKQILAESDYVILLKDFLEQKGRLEKRVTEIQKQLAQMNKEVLPGEYKRQLIEQYIKFEHLDRQLVEKMIAYILVGKRNCETGEVLIEIYWNF